MSESGLSGIERDLCCRGYPVDYLTLYHGGVQRVIASKPGARTITYFRKAHMIKIDEGKAAPGWLPDTGIQIQEKAP